MFSAETEPGEKSRSRWCARRWTHCEQTPALVARPEGVGEGLPWRWVQVSAGTAFWDCLAGVKQLLSLRFLFVKSPLAVELLWQLSQLLAVSVAIFSPKMFSLVDFPLHVGWMTGHRPEGVLWFISLHCLAVFWNNSFIFAVLWFSMPTGNSFKFHLNQGHRSYSSLPPPSSAVRPSSLSQRWY